MADDTDVMGILSIVFSFLFPPIGIVFGIIGYANRKKKNASTTLSMIGLVLSLLFLLLTLFFAAAFLAAFGVYERPIMEGCFMESTRMACQALIPSVSEGANNAAIVQLGLRNNMESGVIITGVTAIDDTGSCGNVRSIDVTDVEGASLNETGDHYRVDRYQTFMLIVTCEDNSYVQRSEFRDTFSINYTELDSGLTGLIVRVRAVAKT
ncbi:MAG: hypothetical protein ACMXYL_04670 [Candidatus Woesearchaeota archaeon]